MTVNDKTKEAASAKIMVIATGENNFPSSPCKVNNGYKHGNNHKHAANSCLS